MSELRIVLLGRTAEVKCRVGKLILGGKDFSVRDQCERIRTEVNGKHVTVINTPDLLDPELSYRKLSHQIETCVNLSAPGPHAFLLVLQGGQFSKGDRKSLERILGSFCVEAFQYSVVLVTNSSGKRSLTNALPIKKHPIKYILEKCNGRSHSFSNPAEINIAKVTELMGKIEQMVGENFGSFLNCEILREPESRGLGSKESSISQTALRRKWKSQELPWTQQKMEVAKGERLNLVVFGRRGAGKTSAANAILGQRETSVDLRPSSEYESREREVCGRLLTVVELPALCEVQPSVSTVSHLFTSVCGPGVHAFLLVIQVGSLTDDDKAEITRIKEIFGSRVTHYMMVLFIHKSPTAQPILRFLQESF
ncbi:hypothetical protein GJAV_G00223360 [Gymnothorax javanicus]|nr:hypothetical protein GJAV_G00223360 [Gymnothorax javanicus]